MNEADKSRDRFSDLRIRAEAALNRRFPPSGDLGAMTREDVEGLVHELQVHQIELEVQNEELRRAQELLADSRDKYSDLYDFAPLGYFTLDRRGIILEANLTGVALLGTDRGALLGKQFAGLLGGGDEDAFFLHKEKVLETGQKGALELKLRKSDGQVFEAELNTMAVEDCEGRSTRLAIIVSDITDRKTAETRLKDALRAKEVLLREVHHRVKNNLAVINSLISLQSHFAGNRPADELFTDLQGRIRSIALVHELLYRSQDLGEIEAAAYMVELISNLKDSMEVMGKAVEISLDLDEIHFDLDTAIPLGFVLNELVSNAFKHAFTGEEKNTRTIKVSLCEIRKGLYELMVADNGVGLPGGIDFLRPDSMGLELVAAFVDQLGGTVIAKNDQGTEIRVTFMKAPPKRKF